MQNVHFSQDIENLLDQIKNIPGKYIIITDPNIEQLYIQQFERNFKDKNQKYEIFILPCGEQNKSQKQIQKALDQMFDWSFDRNDQMICIGGGVITDFGGYLASIYMRGIKHILIPTTLLSMVDASIGGKTGVNHFKGKNLIGTFYHPQSVHICLKFLKSLDQKQFNNGMAEVIKAACIKDKQLFDFIYENDLKKDQDLEYVIKRSIKIKLDIVQKDEKENDLRKLLNFGHTIGHGIELSCKILHGEAVSIGMVLELQIAKQQNLIQQDQIDMLISCLQKYNLPIYIKNDCESVFEYMSMDKKKIGDQIQMIFIKNIGEAYQQTFFASKQYIINVLSQQVQIDTINQLQNIVIPQIPGSKSISNRCLILTALANQQIILNNFLDSIDTQICIDALIKLNMIKIINKNDQNLQIEGLGIQNQYFDDLNLFFNNSGTSARFVMPLLMLLKGSFIIKGNKHMHDRPIEDLLHVLIQQGAKIQYLEKQGYLPIKFISNGSFPGGCIEINGQQSSQFISGILMISPYAQNQVTLNVKNMVSEQFIDMTIQMMQEFDIKTIKNDNQFIIQKSNYQSKFEYFIEPDATSVTYCMAYITLTGGSMLIKNLGHYSTQGDKAFAFDFLKAIGVNVTQINDEIQIIQKQETDLKEFDMNFSQITDTFLTACVIAATIQKPCKITGIENQKVKECNRISGMIKNLKKLTIYCEELKDGILIFGKKVQKDKQKQFITIKTYQDHRMAMAFTVLAAFYHKYDNFIQIIIDDKFCVQKTFPNFYQHFQQDLNIVMKAQIQQQTTLQNNIVLLGMRGAGKTTFSKKIQQQLQIDQIDLDEQIIEHETDINQIIWKKGWDYFRQKEYELLKQLLQNNQQNLQVIACGGGVVENFLNRELLKYEKNTIFIQKDIYEILEDLQQSQRPNLPDDIHLIYKNREKFFNEAKFTYTLPSRQQIKQHQNIYWKRVNSIFVDALKRRFFKKRQIIIKEDSFFLCTFIDELILNIDKLDKINMDYECLELRCDKNIDNLKQLQFQCAIIKYFVKIPLILTLRSIQQGGYFEGNYYKILKKLANFLIFDIIDVEYSQQNFPLIKKLQNYYTLIISQHLIEDNQAIEMYEQMSDFCENLNQDNLNVIMKLVLISDTHIYKIKNLHKLKKTQLIIISSKISRVQQKFLLPVYDPEFSSKTHFNQLTKYEILNYRKELIQQQQKKYYIIRENPQFSISPEIHNLAFKITQKNDCIYDRFNPINENMIEELLKSESFYGASVSMPYKQTVMKYCDFIFSQNANNINTLIKFDNKIYGFNTDIYGIYQPLKKILNLSINQQNYQDFLNYGLIIGSGCCAMSCLQAFKMLNLTPIIFCRKSQNIVYFENNQCIIFYEYDKLEKFVQNKNLKVIFSAIPIQNDFYIQLRNELFINKPIVFDSFYNKQTKLIELGIENSCQVLTGKKMLVYQAFKQIELFCGKKIERKIFKKSFDD